jgi:CRP-like cAMP-binding protein
VQRHAVAGSATVRRLNILGITATADLDEFWKLVKVRDGIERGQPIGSGNGTAKHFTMLLKGVACFSTQHEDGERQIHTFHYPGDFVGLNTFLFPPSPELCEVQALAGSSIGTIDRDALEHAMQRHPALGRALWRAALTEVSIYRQHLVVSRRPALQRVAHLLCEQLARLGIDDGVIPLMQVDVADAAGLSVVHLNRIFQELRQFGVLSKQRVVEVVNAQRLQELAAFDAGYLNPGESLSRWDLRIDG